MGPYGFTMNFFHHFEDLIKLEFWNIVEDSRVSRNIFIGFNATFLTIIAKCKGGDFLEKITPIIMCNVIYKIITKVIANRLKPLLHYLISLEQSAFVDG